METGKRNLARLFIIQILLMVLLLSFALTFRADRSRMAFSGDEGDVAGEVMSPSVYRLLWGRSMWPNRPQNGFSDHELHGELRGNTLSGNRASIFGWFLDSRERRGRT